MERFQVSRGITLFNRLENFTFDLFRPLSETEYFIHFQRLYIDGKDHLLGKLASYVAKALLQGNRVVVFNCDKINIAGSFYRYTRIRLWNSSVS